MRDGFSWKELEGINIQTLEELANQGLLQEMPTEEMRSFVIDRWLFLLHSLNLGKGKVDGEDLRKIQDEIATRLYL